MHRCFFIKNGDSLFVRKVVQLRGFLVQHHLIIDENEIHLIDGGFIGGISRIKNALAKLGKTFSDLSSIVLTHGHLDHSLNLARLQQLSGCQVFAPRLDRGHLEGHHPYRGLSRLCGWLEKIGRFFFRFKAPKVDHWFDDGDELAGLKVIALPGHTLGHCGFLLAEEKLLIAGDLFTNHLGKAAMPPRIFNDDHDEAKKSIRKAAQLELNGIFLNHAWPTTPSKALISLINLADDL